MLLSSTSRKWPRADQCVLLGCMLFVALPNCQAQNLVPNPSFEETDSCNFGLGFRYSGQGPLVWFSASVHPDHLQSCLEYGALNGLPLNLATYQEVLEDSSCVGMVTYHVNGTQEQREWVMAPLLMPMQIGQTYYCSFYANAAFGGLEPQAWIASSNIGMLFTMEPRPWDFFDPYPIPFNHAHILRPEVLSDTVAWSLVSGSFVADSAYQYLMIGNFFDNASTDTLHFGDGMWQGIQLRPLGYTLIDKVCVSTDPMGCDLQNGVFEVGRKGPVIFPNPATESLRIANAQGAYCTVLDGSGRTVWAALVLADPIFLDVRTWAKGMYTIRLTEARMQETHKFVLIE